MAQHREGIDAGGLPGGPAAPATGPSLGRVDTAVTPVIHAEAVAIPTPAWGALSISDTEVLEPDRVASGAPPADRDGAEWGAEGVEAAPRSGWLGWAAFLLALGAAAVHGVAVVADAGRDYELATVLAWVAICVSGTAVLAGIIAAVLGRGRGPGIAGAIVGAVANPWLLLQMLTLLRG